MELTGFCIEEQAVAQAGDDRYSLSRRAERVDAAAHPLAAQVGPVIFGDPDTRFTPCARLQPRPGREQDGAARPGRRDRVPVGHEHHAGLD